MTAVDEVVMDTVGRNTANMQGLQVEDCEVSFAPSSMEASGDLIIYPYCSQVRAEQTTNQDNTQAGPSGLQQNILGN